MTADKQKATDSYLALAAASLASCKLVLDIVKWQKFAVVNAMILSLVLGVIIGVFCSAPVRKIGTGKLCTSFVICFLLALCWLATKRVFEADWDVLLLLVIAQIFLFLSGDEFKLPRSLENLLSK